jgi:hypothetical protein
MTARDDIMKDYVPVSERIAAFLEKHPDGSLQSEMVELSETRVVMRAYAYRTPDDPRPGIGYSSLEIPGRTPYTRGSEIENAETSSWGRAIAALGFEVKRGIASREEVDNKREPGPAAKQGPPMIRHLDPNSLVGTIELSKDSPDFLPKVSPEGGTLTFKLVSPAGGIKVISHGKLAYDLSMEKDDVIGKLATCYGRVTDEWFMSKGHKVTYQVLTLNAIRVGQLELPAPEPPEEAPSIPLFDEDEQAVLDAATESAAE